MKYDDQMDEHCVALCDAMNSFPGVRTLSSCQGHGKQQFTIDFRVDSLENLPAILYWFDACHSGKRYWNVGVHTDCGMDPAVFTVYGPVGEQAYKDAAFLAALLAKNVPANCAG